MSQKDLKKAAAGLDFHQPRKAASQAPTLQKVDMVVLSRLGSVHCPGPAPESLPPPFAVAPPVVPAELLPPGGCEERIPCRAASRPDSVIGAGACCSWRRSVAGLQASQGAASQGVHVAPTAFDDPPVHAATAAA
jgi:hypothetical protein